MCQGTARARRVSGAIGDGRWSKSSNCCLWRGHGVPLSLTEAPTALQRDKTELQTWGCPAESQMPVSHVPGALTEDNHHHLTCPQSHHHPAVPKALQSGWMGLGDPCWAQRDRMGQAAGRTAQGRHSSDPTGATKALGWTQHG